MISLVPVVEFWCWRRNIALRLLLQNSHTVYPLSHANLRKMTLQHPSSGHQGMQAEPNISQATEDLHRIHTLHALSQDHAQLTSFLPSGWGILVQAILSVSCCCKVSRSSPRRRRQSTALSRQLALNRRTSKKYSPLFKVSRRERGFAGSTSFRAAFRL